MAYTRFPTVDAPPPRRSSRLLGAGNDRAAAPPSAAATGPSTARRAAPSGAQAKTKLPLLAAIFILAIFNPLVFSAGSLSLSPSRLLIALLFVPSLFWYVSGRAGKFLPQDMFFFGFGIWVALALYNYGGFGSIELIGISIMEVLTPFLLARCLIRSEAQYDAFLNFMMIVVGVMMVGAALEAILGIRIFSAVFDPIGHTYAPLPISYEQRLGMNRAQTVFQHPILYGMAMMMFFAPFWFSRRKDGRIGGPLRASISFLATFFSLSTGAWLGMMVQLMLITWGAILRLIAARWKILIALTVVAYVTIDLLSNRTPFDVFISYATLNTGTAYMRKLIFVYGMDNVWANPIFGLGLNDWERPDWMHASSVDNLWLGYAMRYGIPGFLFFAGGYLAVIFTLARKKLSSESVSRHRTAVIMSLVGGAMAYSTVYMWGTILYLLMFFLGANSWILEHPEEETAGEEPAADRVTRADRPRSRSS